MTGICEGFLYYFLVQNISIFFLFLSSKEPFYSNFRGPLPNSRPEPAS